MHDLTMPTAYVSKNSLLTMKIFLLFDLFVFALKTNKSGNFNKDLS